MNRDNYQCPKCGSHNTIKYGWRIRFDEKRRKQSVRQYRCKDCGQMSTNNAEVRY